MGFTPLEGLMMGSRSGSVDPGILIHLLRHYNFDADKLDEMLNRASGLKGISGVSSDMREIINAIAQGNSRAQLAFDMYVHSLSSYIGAMLGSLGGLDVLVFTGGVGENAADVRKAACQAFEFLGVKLDLERNSQSPADADIATPDSIVRVLIVKAQEDWAIATECWRLAKSEYSNFQD
jgi:acetate kinase